MSSHEWGGAYSATTGASVDTYVPCAEWDANPNNRHRLTLDGAHPYDAGAPGVARWEPLHGHRALGRAGCVFDPAECATDEQIREWVREAGGDVFALVGVEAPCSPDEPCFPDEPDHCERYGCDAPPAGWAIPYRPAE